MVWRTDGKSVLSLFIRGTFTVHTILCYGNFSYHSYTISAVKKIIR